MRNGSNKPGFNMIFLWVLLMGKGSICAKRIGHKTAFYLLFFTIMNFVHVYKVPSLLNFQTAFLRYPGVLGNCNYSC